MKIKNTTEELGKLRAALNEAGLRCFCDRSMDPTRNAQENLEGRSYYYSDGTLQWHGTRVIWSGTQAENMLFCAVTSDSLDMHHTRRGFRYVVHDLLGNCVSRVDLENSMDTSKKARKALDDFELDVVAWYTMVLGDKIKRTAEELDKLKKALEICEEA